MIREFWKQQSTAQKVTILFILTLFFRAFFALNIGLIDDEAYHWSWVQDLQLSYFDHPGMIAWLEAITTKIFGDTVLGVRLPGFLCFTGVVVLMYQLTKDLFDDAAAIFVGLILLWSPFWGFGGYVASPEPPFMLCWVAAAWVFWQGVREDDKRWSVKKTWLWLGVLMGLGLNSKFIIALLAPGFGLYLLMTPHRRKDLLTPWPWVGFLIATVMCSPIFLWNHLHDWPGFKYQFSTRHSTTQGIDFSRWLVFLAAQLLFYTPFLFALLVLTFITSFLRIKEARWRFLFCLTVPSFAVFYPQPLFAEYKPHWSGAACTLLLMGAGAIWSQGLIWGQREIVKVHSRVYKWGLLAFFVPMAFITYAPFAYPWLPKAYKFLNPQGTWKTTYDPSNEFTGWEELGQFVNRRQREIHAESGRKPFLAAQRYETTAQTTWGTRQKVYMLNFTVSQYTAMQTPEEMNNLKGQDAIFISTEKYEENPMEWAKWDECQKEELKTFRHGVHARTFFVFYCKNFQGILK